YHRRQLVELLHRARRLGVDAAVVGGPARGHHAAQGAADPRRREDPLRRAGAVAHRSAPRRRGLLDQLRARRRAHRARRRRAHRRRQAGPDHQARDAGVRVAGAHGDAARVAGVVRATVGRAAATIFVAVVAFVALWAAIVWTWHPRADADAAAEPVVLARTPSTPGEATLLFAGDTAEIDFA